MNGNDALILTVIIIIVIVLYITHGVYVESFIKMLKTFKYITVNTFGNNKMNSFTLKDVVYKLYRNKWWKVNVPSFSRSIFFMCQCPTEILINFEVNFKQDKTNERMKNIDSNETLKTNSNLKYNSADVSVKKTFLYQRKLMNIMMTTEFRADILETVFFLLILSNIDRSLATASYYLEDNTVIISMVYCH